MADPMVSKVSMAATPTAVPSSAAVTPMGAPSPATHPGPAAHLMAAVDGRYASVAGAGSPGMPSTAGMVPHPGVGLTPDRAPTMPMAQPGVQPGASPHVDSAGASLAVPAVAAAVEGSTVAGGSANGDGHAAMVPLKTEGGAGPGGGTGPSAASSSPNGVVAGGGGNKGSTLGKRPGSQAQSKPQSAWMLFIQDRREQVKLDNPDMAVTQQQKIMSEIWKTMSGDEREAYRSRARDDQKRYKAEQADKQPAAKKEDSYGTTEGGTSTELVCPLGRIGRIIKLDQDVQSVTKEATALIGKAMELFTALVAKEAFAVSQSQNRRLLKLQDITDIMHNQDQFYWIKDDFPQPPR